VKARARGLPGPGRGEAAAPPPGPKGMEMDRAFLLQFAPEAVMLLFAALGAAAALILMRPFLRWYLGLGRMEETLHRLDTRLEDLFLLLEEEDGRDAARARAVFDFPEPPAVPPSQKREPEVHSRLRDLEAPAPRPRAPEPHLSRVPDPPLAHVPERPVPPAAPSGGALRFRSPQARRPVIRKNT